MEKHRLIKLSDTHYIVVDDSEKEEDGFVYNHGHSRIEKYLSGGSGLCRKITRSTQPLELVKDPILTLGSSLGFNKIKHIPLSEVKEVIYGYSIDLTNLCFYDNRNPDFQIKEEYGYDKEEVEATGNFAKKDCNCDNCFYGRAELTEQLIAHQELVKDKLFTVEDMLNYSQVICEKLPKLKKLQTSQADDYGNNLDVILKIQDEFIQSLLPKTEWDVEFVDGKLKLL